MKFNNFNKIMNNLKLKNKILKIQIFINKKQMIIKK